MACCTFDMEIVNAAVAGSDKRDLILKSTVTLTSDVMPTITLVW